MKKEKFDIYLKNGLYKQDDDLTVVRAMTNRLLENLYLPVDSDSGFVTDQKKLKKWELDGEPINWGDLSVCDVRKLNNFYEITIEEADANCPMLCNYVKYFLDKWGWEVEIKTEW